MGHDFKVKCRNEAKEAFSNEQESCLPAKQVWSIWGGFFWFYLLEYSASLIHLKKPSSSVYTLGLYLPIPADLLEAINAH